MKAERRLPSLHEFFAPGGVLSRTHPAYEFRRGQLDMAKAVEDALSQRKHLLIEAGTGTGKTLAYLLPVIRSGKRVISLPEPRTCKSSFFTRTFPFSKSTWAGCGSVI